MAKLTYQDICPEAKIVYRHSDGDWGAFTLIDGDDIYVVVNTKHGLEKRHMDILHELSHILRHKDLNVTMDQYKFLEDDANRMAFELTVQMEKELVKEYYKKLFTGELFAVAFQDFRKDVKKAFSSIEKLVSGMRHF